MRDVPNSRGLKTEWRDLRKRKGYQRELHGFHENKEKMAGGLGVEPR
jgi:hypothetical protein